MPVACLFLRHVLESFVKAQMRNFRVRWDSLDGKERVVSVVSYSRKCAEDRAAQLREQGYENVEVYESKIGSYEEVVYPSVLPTHMCATCGEPWYYDQPVCLNPSCRSHNA